MSRSDWPDWSPQFRSRHKDLSNRLAGWARCLVATRFRFGDWP